MRTFFETYKWGIVGGVIGLLVAILLLTLGFFKTLLLLILTISGICFGVYLKNSGIIEQFFPANRK